MTAHAAQAEFAGFPASRMGDRVEGAVECFLRLSSECGGLIPQAMLQSALGISSQRVSQLVQGDRFEVHKIGTLTFVTGRSFEKYLTDEKTAGRGLKAPRFSTVLHMVRDTVREHRAGKKRRK